MTCRRFAAACGRPPPPAVRERRCRGGPGELAALGNPAEDRSSKGGLEIVSISHASVRRSSQIANAMPIARPRMAPITVLRSGSGDTADEGTWALDLGDADWGHPRDGEFPQALFERLRALASALWSSSPPGRVVSGICESWWWTAWRSCLISWAAVSSRSAMYSWATASARRAARSGSVSVDGDGRQIRLGLGDHVDVSRERIVTVGIDAPLQRVELQQAQVRRRLAVGVRGGDRRRPEPRVAQEQRGRCLVLLLLLKRPRKRRAGDEKRRNQDREEAAAKKARHGEWAN